MDLTEPISKFIDHFIQPYVSNLPSFIQDTTHVLNKLALLNNIEHCYLVTMDVEALYTNIDHEEGLNALSHYLNTRPASSTPPTEFLLTLTKWTLENNVFLFQNDLYQQIKGTAMGACYAPSLANLFMGLWEEHFVYSHDNPYRNMITFYGRYIDDLVFLFSGTEQELTSFHRYLNNTNKNLKLSIQYDLTQIDFLDLTIQKDKDGRINTTVFRKPTDRNTLLRADSFHPPSLKKNIPYGQFQRLKRICDQESDFETKAEDMKLRFKNRGYKSQVINEAYNKTKSLKRQDLLQHKQKTPGEQQVYLVTQYNTRANELKKIINNNWEMIECDPALKEIFPTAPVVSFKRAPTIGDKLVHSYLPGDKKNTWLERRPQGFFKCGRCNHCTTMQQTNTFTDVHAQKTHYIKGYINCNTTYVVYYLYCPCGHFYIGRTKRKLQQRVAEHKYAIRTGNEDYPMAKHYKQHHGCNPESLRAMGIESIELSKRGGDKLKKLLQRETYWIYTLKALTRPGLNEDLDYTPFL